MRKKHDLIEDIISKSKKVIDLGCGNNPVKGATTAVDLYLDPCERSYGFGDKIDVNAMKNKNIDFINANLNGTLPFKEKEFDFSYSSHVLEHLDDPIRSCKEIMRISKSGVIITPSYFSEIIFGRSYHKWLVIERNGCLLFFKKRDFEDRPFGDHPVWNNDFKNWDIDDKTNPFDILLNEGNWYKGQECMPRLSKKIQNYYLNHSSLMEVIFLWENQFECMKYE